MKKVFVCSPFAGNVEENVRAAKEYCRIEVKSGNMPIAPHLIYPQFMDDGDPYAREMAMRYGLELMKICDELHVYGGKISNGMAREIACWREMGRKERHFSVMIVIKERDAC